MQKIHTDGMCFIDESGRTRVFSGINICDKGEYGAGGYKYSQSWNSEIYTQLRDRGVNVVRLGITWDAVEPQPGQYNEEFIDKLIEILEECERIGVYVYIDMHQDLYSGFKNGCGDGAPSWACLTGGYEHKRAKLVWAEGYFFDKAVHNAFDNFWQNSRVRQKGLQDYYADMWAHLASRLSGHASLLGFDLMNEPFMGAEGGKIFLTLVKTAVADLLKSKSVNRKELIQGALLPSKRQLLLRQISVDVFRRAVERNTVAVNRFDTERFSPFINKVTAAIRSKTDEGIIFFENCYYSNLGIPCAVKPIEVGGAREAKQAFSPHAYDLMVDTPLYEFADNKRVGAIFEQRRAEQTERLKLPVMVGEWGGNSIGTRWLPHVEYLLDIFDRNHWSNTYWAFTPETIGSDVMGVLCRPYPRAVTGDIIEYYQNRDLNCFTLTYEQDREYDLPTEIYAHRKIKSVESDGEVSIEPLDVESSIIFIKTMPGKHTVQVQFEGAGRLYK